MSSLLTLQNNAIIYNVHAVELRSPVITGNHGKMAQLIKYTISKQENLTLDPWIHVFKKKLGHAGEPEMGGSFGLAGQTG